MSTDPSQENGIDWDAIRRRLGVTQTPSDASAGLLSAERKKKIILKERARLLSQEPVDETDSQDSLEVVEFRLAYETYGIESRYIREIYTLKELTPLPLAPAFVLGIVNVRGQIVSVIDLKKLFELPEKGLTDLNKIIILESADMWFGILADLIVGVRQINLAELHPALPTLTGIREEFLKGITTNAMTLLDGGKLLSSSDVIVNQEVE